jgi:hypothetical protein
MKRIVSLNLLLFIVVMCSGAFFSGPQSRNSLYSPWTLNGDGTWTGDSTLDCSDEPKTIQLAAGASGALVIESGNRDYLKITTGPLAIYQMGFGNTFNNPAYMFQGNGPMVVGGPLHIKEMETPTPIADYGAIYAKTNNSLYFQDGAGDEHLIHGEAFGSIWFHNTTPAIVTIATQDTLTLIDSFENPGIVDDAGRITASTANNDLELNADAGGVYNVAYSLSITAVGATRQYVMVTGVELATPQVISLATNATPIVITSVGHEKLNGDLITIAGCTGNTGANGHWMVSAVTADEITLVDLQGDDSVGNGAYDADSGSITIWYPGCLITHRAVSNVQLGVASNSALIHMEASDKLGLYAANINNDTDLNIFAVVLNAERGHVDHE